MHLSFSACKVIPEMFGGHGAFGLVVVLGPDSHLPKEAVVPHEFPSPFQRAVLHRHVPRERLDFALAAWLFSAQHGDGRVCEPIGGNDTKCQILRTPSRRSGDQNRTRVRVWLPGVFRS